jgi:hypothetical protein
MPCRIFFVRARATELGRRHTVAAMFAISDRIIIQKSPAEAGLMVVLTMPSHRKRRFSPS